jgi:prepilin-type N-terminal cleavage/methylation domain-containing protein
MKTTGESSIVRFNKERPGFTLVEILLVIMLISLMASVGGGFYIGTLKGLQVEKAARDLLLTAKYARIMALEQQRQYELCLDTQNNGFYLIEMQVDRESGQSAKMIVRDPYCKPVVMDTDVRFENIQIIPTGLESVEQTEDLQSIFFFPDGTAQSASIQIGDNKTHYAMGINAATGKATLYQGTIENVKISTIDLDAEE